MRPNPYRRPVSPRARRAEMMRAAAMRKRARINDGYEDPYDLMYDVRDIVQDLSRTDVFIDAKAVRQLEKLEGIVATGLNWEIDYEGEDANDMDENSARALRELSDKIEETWSLIKDLNYTVGTVRL
jgi:hypothetical protein